jgi:ABC-type glycerol-3-phosphate transport system permease component
MCHCPMLVGANSPFVLGLWLALPLDRHLPFKAFLRAIVLLPFIVPTALSANAFWFRLATAIFRLGLCDTRLAPMLTYPTFLIPFCTWPPMGHFRSIPFELEECALIDGATRLQILVKIILPLAVPGLTRPESSHSRCPGTSSSMR